MLNDDDIDDIDDEKSFLDLADDLLTDFFGSESDPIIPYLNDMVQADLPRGPRAWIRTRMINRGEQATEIEEARENNSVRNRFIFTGSFCDSLIPSKKEKKVEKKRVAKNKENDEKITQITESTDLYY